MKTISFVSHLAIAFILCSNFTIYSHHAYGQVQYIAPVMSGDKVTADIFTREDTELSAVFQTKSLAKNTFSSRRLLNDEGVRKSLEVSDQQMKVINEAESNLAKALKEKSIKEHQEFQALRAQLQKKNVDEEEINQFVMTELKKIYAQNGRKNHEAMEREVANVLTKKQMAELNSLKQRTLLVQVGLENYLINQKVLDQICKDETRKRVVAEKVTELSKDFEAELKKLKLKYQKEIIDSLNRDEKETVTEILDLSIADLKTELVGRSMLLKNDQNEQ